MRLIAAGGFLALAAGCGSSSSATGASAGGSSSPTVSSSATGSPTSAPTTTPPSTGSSSNPQAQGPAPCPTSGLKVATGPRQGAAGSVYVALEFTNTSGTTCTLYGYPGVALAASNRAQIGAPATRDGSKPKQLITLKPGATGSATLRIPQAMNYPAAKCGPVQAAYLQIYPPNQTAHVDIPYQTLGCSKQLTVLTIGTVVTGMNG